MSDNNVQITSKGIKNSLKKYTSLKSICEYVWNGFDAKATQVIVEASENILGNISFIKVVDNGYGIARNQLDDKFRPFFQSEKIYDPNAKQSDVHGKNGVGRLTFFTFSPSASWTTVYSCEGKNYEYTISVAADELNHYRPSTPVAVEKATGTTVEFYDVTDGDLSIAAIRDQLCN